MRLPHPLRRRWRQGTHHLGGVGHPLGSDGKPTDTRVRVFRVRFRWKLWPRQVTGDTTYGPIENIVAVEDQHIRAYVPLPDFDKRTSVYGKQSFRYEPERDVYVCPNDAILPLHTHAYHEREKRYQADAATCNACPLKAECTTSDQGHLLKCSFDEEYLEQVRAYHTTEPYQKAMRKRSVWVEPLFAEGKQWHGMQRFRLRLLWRVNSEALMIAAGQNLKRLLKKWGWGRRPYPAEAVCALFLAAFRWLTHMFVKSWSFSRHQRSFFKDHEGMYPTFLMSFVKPFFQQAEYILGTEGCFSSPLIMTNYIMWEFF